ncbi:uncharacterized protein LOC120345067 isoform X2 [Styela clava]
MQKSIASDGIGKAEIGPEGGSIHFKDCFVTIPPGALNHPVLFELNLQTDSTQFCPEDFVGITSVLCSKFRCIFSLDEETTKKEVFPEMNRAEYSPTPLWFDRLTVKCGNKISIKISAESYETTQNYTFTPINKNGFTISEDLWKGNRKVIEFQVSPLPQPQEFLDVHFELNQNGKTERSAYNMLWPELDFIDEID